ATSVTPTRSFAAAPMPPAPSAPICRRRPTPSTGRRSRTKSHPSPADDGAVLYPRAPWDPVAATDGRFDWVGGADEAEGAASGGGSPRSEEHTSELQSREKLVCRLLLEKKKKPAK